MSSARDTLAVRSAGLAALLLYQAENLGAARGRFIARPFRGEVDLKTA